MKIIKENYITIILISVIITILLGLGVFIYKITNKYKNIDNNITITEFQAISNTNNDISQKNIIVQERENDETFTNSTLIQIASIFNNCNITQKMILQGYTMEATATPNEINVFSSGDGLAFNVKFILNDNVLSVKILYNDSDSRLTAIKSLLAVTLIDCVGQAKGFSDGALSTALGRDEAMNYTLENEGVEIKLLENSKGMEFRVDLNSNFLFLNM